MGDATHITLNSVVIVGAGTGQDQMRIVKQRMIDMVPDVCVFLDVDGPWRLKA